MSMTGATVSGSGSSNGSLDRPSTSRSGSLEIGQSTRERRRSREASLPLDVEQSRPRSPKPEADGKLDRYVVCIVKLISRSFKFPLKSSSPPIAVGAREVSLPEPAAAPATERDTISEAKANTEESQSNGSHDPVSEPAIYRAPPHEGEAVSSPPTVASPPKSTSANTESTEDPTSKPAQISNDVQKDETKQPRANTIDEAISNFHSAVKTPEPETSLTEPPTAPEDRLVDKNGNESSNGDLEDGHTTLEENGHRRQTAPSDEENRKNGQQSTAETDEHIPEEKSSDGELPTSRKVNGTKRNGTKGPQNGNNHNGGPNSEERVVRQVTSPDMSEGDGEGEGATMDEIDLS